MPITLKKTRKQSAQVETTSIATAASKALTEAALGAAIAVMTAEPEPSEPLPASFLSVAQAAAYAGVSTITIRRWIKAKVFRCHRAGKQWKIDPKELVSFMRRSAHC